MIAIVGTGIHGMHLFHRIRRDPKLRAVPITLIDPQEEPFSLWKQRVRNCGMTHLRSPGSHGIAPVLPQLRRVVEQNTAHGIDGELHPPSIPPYHRPSVGVFSHHLSLELAATAAIPGIGPTAHIRGSARKVNPGLQDITIDVEQPDGTPVTVRAGSVILAPGQSEPFVPDPFVSLLKLSRSATPQRALALTHIYNCAFDPGEVPAGDRIAIIGGGIAAAHLALYLVRRGALVCLWTREPLRAFQFDSDPCFIGSRCGDYFRSVQDYGVRRSIIHRSRRSGSIPPDLLCELLNAEVAGGLTIIRGEIGAAELQGDQGTLLEGQSQTGTVQEHYDRVVLATGFLPDPPAESLIETIAARTGAPRAEDRYPRLTSDLSWVEGIYCTGGLAELELGPPARNIIGAHMAGRLIVPALRRRHR